MNIVWGTASTGGYGGTVFPGGVRYSLVNNVCGVRYSLGYRIHSDTGLAMEMVCSRSRSLLCYSVITFARACMFISLWSRKPDPFHSAAPIAFTMHTESDRRDYCDLLRDRVRVRVRVKVRVSMHTESDRRC